MPMMVYRADVSDDELDAGDADDDSSFNDALCAGILMVWEAPPTRQLPHARPPIRAPAAPRAAAAPEQMNTSQRLAGLQPAKAAHS